MPAAADLHLGCRVEQERVAQELAGLQERLEARQASLQQLQSSSGGVLALKANYDRVVGELAAERDGLQRERLQLMQVRTTACRLKTLEASRLMSKLEGMVRDAVRSVIDFSHKCVVVQLAVERHGLQLEGDHVRVRQWPWRLLSE